MKKILFALFTGFIFLNSAFGQLSVSFAVTHPTCSGYNDGAIDLSISGGTLPYTILWYHQSDLISAAEDLNGLVQGEYIVQVIDSAGLTIMDTAWLFPPYEISTIDTIADATCYSGNGTINITPSGGTPFYVGILSELLWDPYLQEYYIDSTLMDTLMTNIDTTSLIWSVPAGNYMVFIADNSGLGCVIQKFIVINQPSAPLTFNTTFDNVTCKGGSDGWITIVPDGGTPPYTYAWSGGQTTSSITAQAAGIYTLTVIDANSCSKTESIEIEEPFQSLLIYEDVADVSCRDNHDGAVTVTLIENALAPYTYAWSNGTSASEITGLDAGTYSVTITDANSCQTTETYTVGLNDIDCIVIYNVVTPDGNGKNDVWEIKNIHLYPDCSVAVYNRWGKQVFSSDKGYDNLWDCTSDGKLLESGDYYYIINLNFGNYPPYTGPVKILK
ncbi:MAG: hypothetical protein A2W91_05720 [Bacteroidetes bacterium GWF2_38_335]|nr:MAG: hypothetical protein A2W91_05720 [Bacteroidetes bacterium GWF2_38_335]HBS88923.1 hypothetical protein [Bacteroidales bacterium]